MGKCYSKKPKQHPLIQVNKPIIIEPDPLRNQDIEPETSREKKQDTAQSIYKELQQNQSFEQENPAFDEPKIQLNPLHSEPILSISERPLLTKRNSLEINEILIQTSPERDPSMKSLDLRKKLIEVNNINDFFENRRFFTAFSENLGFNANPLDKLDHIPRLRSRNNISIIESIKKLENYEKWLCLYEFEIMSQVSQVFLYVYKDDPYELRKNLFIKLKSFDSNEIYSIYEVFSMKKKDFLRKECLMETVICEYARSDLKQLIEKRQIAKVPYTEEEVLAFMNLALTGLQALKAQGIVHLALNTESFIYNEEYKIAGLGEAFLLEENKTQSLLLLENDKKNYRFMAPEILDLLLKKTSVKRIKDPSKCDLYSLGIIILDMLRLEATPIEYCKSDYLPTLFDSLTRKYKIVVYLLRNMLAFEPEERLDIEKLLLGFMNNEKTKIEERKFLNKPKKFNSLQKGLLVNELMFQKEYLNREESYYKIMDFYQKGLVFFNLDQFHLAIEQLSFCLKFERFLIIMPEEIIFSIFVTLGLAYLKQDLNRDARKYFQKADSWFKSTKLQGDNNSKKPDLEESMKLEKSHQLFESGFSEKKSSNIMNSSIIANKIKTQDEIIEPNDLREEDSIKYISLLYYLALSSYKMADYETCKLHLTEIWTLMNLKTLISNEFLSDYFQLCGLAYNLLGKYALSAKCFLIYKEKSNDLALALSYQAKLDLFSGNYLEAYDYFIELLLFLDVKENDGILENYGLLETFGFLLQLSELIQDKSQFFYCLERTQDLFHGYSKDLEFEPQKVSIILDWILRFGVYLQYFNEDKAYFLKLILAMIKENMMEYPEKSFLIYVNYCLGKAYYYIGSKDEAIENFLQSWGVIKNFSDKKPFFQSNLIIYCAIDTFIWLAFLTNNEQYSEDLNELCEDFLLETNENLGFSLYFKTMRLEFLYKINELEIEAFHQELDILEKSLFSRKENPESLFRFYHELSLLYEKKLLVLLKQDKPSEAKEMIEFLMKNWLDYDQKNLNKGRIPVLIDDYLELRQVSLEESYQYLCEIGWFFQKLIFQFIKNGYLHNAKVLLLRLKSIFFKKGLLERTLFKNSQKAYHFTLPTDESYIDLYSLISTIAYQLDENIKGFEYLMNAYELIEKIWVLELQPKRLKTLIISLTFSMSQAWHLQGNYEKGLEVLEKKSLIFETEKPEITISYKSMKILLQIKSLDLEKAEESLVSMLKSLYLSYEKKKDNEISTKILRFEILRIEILLEKGLLEEGEKGLLQIIQKINQIYKEKAAERVLFEKDWDFKRIYQLIIAKYYGFLMEFEKALNNLTKSYHYAKSKYGVFSIFALEINNLIVENLIRQLKFEKAEEIFSEINENEAFQIKGLALILRKKTEAFLKITLGKYDEALKLIDFSLKEFQAKSLDFKAISRSLLILELVFLKAKAFSFKDQKDEADIVFSEAYSLITKELLGIKTPLIIEILLEIIKERLKRFKIVGYIQLIKGLNGFLPEEKTLLIELLSHKRHEIQMIRSFEKYYKDSDENSLKIELKDLLKSESLGKKGERKKFKNFLLNREEELVETKEMIKKAHFMSLGLYKNHKHNKFLLESSRLLKLSEEI